jgi:hypothetical protein
MHLEYLLIFSTFVDYCNSDCGNGQQMGRWNQENIITQRYTEEAQSSTD